MPSASETSEAALTSLSRSWLAPGLPAGVCQQDSKGHVRLLQADLAWSPWHAGGVPLSRQGKGLHRWDTLQAQPTRARIAGVWALEACCRTSATSLAEVMHGPGAGKPHAELHSSPPQDLHQQAGRHGQSRRLAAEPGSEPIVTLTALGCHQHGNQAVALESRISTSYR